MAKINDYLRVTTVLGPFSGLKNIDPYILNQAAERGSKVHDICSALMEEIGLQTFEPRFDGYIESFNKWVEGKRFIERPPRFYCDEYRITGEVDGIYKDKDGLVLIDIKTSAKENKTWALQGSAYSYLCRKSGINISRIEFVQLSKDGKDAKIYHYKENFELFLKCLEIYKIFFHSNTEEDFLACI